MIRTLVIASLLFELMGLSYHDRLNSDVVILGTLESMHREISGVTERNTGTVRVSRVFAGDVKAGQTIEIFWTNRTDIACRVSHERLKDAEALWFLKRTTSGPYDADNISRALSLAPDELHNFVEYFQKRHGPADNAAEKAIYAWILERDEHH